MAVRPDLALQDEEQQHEEDEEAEHVGPTHHPSAPHHEFFDISTTVDPSYIISLIRKLLPSASDTHTSFPGVASDTPNRESTTDNNKDDSPSKKKSENMDVDAGEYSQRGQFEDSSKGLENSGVSEAWAEYGCVLWDLAGSQTHAELMVENLIFEVLSANLMVCESPRVNEICIGIIGNLACHEVPMKHIVSTNGLTEIIVDKLFVDDPLCLCEICRLLTVGLQSDVSITWAKALQSDNILSRILWIAENTLNVQLIEKSIGLIVAILVSQQKVVDALLPPLMKLGLASLLINLLAFEMKKLASERISERYSILDLILRAVEALSVIDDHSQEICSSKELFQLVCDLIKLPDKEEVANCCVTAAVLFANILSEVADRASEISNDLSFLEGLLDIFPFASNDLEARKALWNIMARILVRIQESELSPSSLYHHVAVLTSKVDLIEDELLNQQLSDSGKDHESLAPSRSQADAEITSLRRIISILNSWTATKDNTENNVIGEALVNDTDVKRLLDCCNKYSK